MKQHILFDLETFSRESDVAIFEIGAVMFDIRTGSVGSKFRTYVDHTIFGTVDAETVAWHREQGTFPLPGRAELLHPQEAIRLFVEWFEQQGEIESVWCWGGTYDFAVLEATWKATAPQIKVPWEYYQECCARSIWRAAFPGLKHDPRPHRALDDALAAVADLVRACQRNGWFLMHPQDYAKLPYTHLGEAARAEGLWQRLIARLKAALPHLDERESLRVRALLLEVRGEGGQEG